MIDSNLLASFQTEQSIECVQIVCLCSFKFHVFRISFSFSGLFGWDIDLHPEWRQPGMPKLKSRKCIRKNDAFQSISCSFVPLRLAFLIGISKVEFLVQNLFITHHSKKDHLVSIAEDITTWWGLNHPCDNEKSYFRHVDLFVRADFAIDGNCFVFFLFLPSLFLQLNFGINCLQACYFFVNSKNGLSAKAFASSPREFRPTQGYGLTSPYPEQNHAEPCAISQLFRFCLF